MKERRKFDRQVFSVACHFEWKEGRAKGQVTNLSYGGARIAEASIVPPEGTEIQLTLHEEGQPVTLYGKVVHTSDPEKGSQGYFGVEFQQRDEQSERKIRPLVRKQLGEDDS